MQKWEYRIVDGRMTEEIMNQWGEQGWELIVISDEANIGRRFYFKRPKP
jgi:hypothetical protein